MDVSIVIPAHNAQATLEDCLAAATRSSCRRGAAWR